MAAPSQPAPASLDRLCVVLVATRNPLNIGAAARAMSNFGCFTLRVVRPWSPAFREAKSAVGAASLLANAEEFDTVANAVADCNLIVGTTAVGPRDLQQSVYPLPQGAAIIQAIQSPGRVALLFGSEKVGLSRDDFSHCHWLMRIPTREEHRSMNLGQAVALCLYEIARPPDTGAARPSEMLREDGSAPMPRGRRDSAIAASAVLTEIFTATLIELLVSCGYLEPAPSLGERQKIRRFVHRLGLSPDDTELCLGMLRQILWKTRSSTGEPR